MIKAGTLLAPHMSEGKVVEYDLDGNVLDGRGKVSLAVPSAKTVDALVSTAGAATNVRIKMGSVVIILFSTLARLIYGAAHVR